MKKHMHLKSFVFLLLLFLVLSTNLAYSALEETLAVTSDATFRASADIRITDVKLTSAENGAVLQYEPTYNVNTFTAGFILPNADSSITYNVTVENFGNVDQTIYEITKMFGNDNINYEITGYEEKDIINFSSKITFSVKFITTSPSDEYIDYKLNFDFKKIYYVSYDENLGSDRPKTQIKYEDIDLIITEDTVQNPGYNFKGWSNTSGSNTVIYNSKDVYSENSDIILYPVWEISSYILKIDPNGGKYNNSSEIKSITQKFGSTLSVDVPSENAYYTVKYDANGGTSAKEEEKIYRDFTGWVLSGKGTLTDNEPIQTSKQTYIYGTSDSLITASYKEEMQNVNAQSASRKYVVTYDLNNTNASLNVQNNESIVEYKMNGWYTKEGLKVADNKGTFDISSNMELYANWTSEKINLAKITKEGYTCNFNTKQDKTGISYESEDEFETDKDITLYVFCQNNTYNVTYNKGDSTSGDVPNSEVATYDENITFKENSLIKDNQNGYNLTYDKGSSDSGTLPNDQVQINSYKADGWTTKVNGDKVYNSNETIKYNLTNNLVLYPAWSTTNGSLIIQDNTMTKNKKNLGTVTFNYNYSGKENVTSTAYETYKANGWTDNKTTYLNGQTIILTNDLTLYPNFDVTKVSATFKKVSRVGYTFSGWYTKETGGEKIESYTGEDDITLYAHWTINEYDVIYNNGDSTSGELPNPQKVKYLSSVTLSVNNLIKDNLKNGYKVTYSKYDGIDGTLPNSQVQTNSYTADGWTTIENGEKVYDSGEVITSYTKAGNLELYPSWIKKGEALVLEKNEMLKENESLGTVTFNYNYSDKENETSSAYKTYTADGWSLETDGTKKDYSNGQSVTLTKNLTLYPYFKENKVSATIKTPTRTGFVFKGWYTASTGGEKVESYTGEDDITLYAHWEEKTLKVILMRNTSSSDNESVEQSFTYNSSNNALASTEFTREGYTLSGWALEKTATTKQYDITSTISDSLIDSKYPTLTLYAVWSINSYTLSVNPNGGVWNNSTSIQQFTQNYLTTKQIAKPTKNAYYTISYDANGGEMTSSGTTLAYRDFTEWTVSGGGTISDSIYTYGSSNGTLTANYSTTANEITTKNATRTYTITYDENNSGATISEASQTLIYEMVGWYTTANGNDESTKRTSEGGGKYSPESSETLYAHWYGNFTMPTVTKTNYICTWDTARSGTRNGYSSGFNKFNPTSSTTFYANCQPEPVKVSLYPSKTATSGIKTIYYTYGKGITLYQNGTYMTTTKNPITIPTKDGYEFLGYYTDETDGTQLIDSNGYVTKNFTSTLYDIGSEINLYAHWQESEDPTIKMYITSSTIDTTQNTPNYSFKIEGTDNIALKTISYSIDGGKNFVTLNKFTTNETSFEIEKTDIEITKDTDYTLIGKVCDMGNNCVTSEIKVNPTRMFIYQAMLQMAAIMKEDGTETDITVLEDNINSSSEISSYDNASDLGYYMATQGWAALYYYFGNHDMAAKIAYQMLLGIEGDSTIGSKTFEEYVKEIVNSDQFKANASNLGLTTKTLE